MRDTKHLRQRMSQRGIGRRMVDYVVDHGRPDQDKIVLDRKGALALLEMLHEEERLLMKILDKGGVVVVTEGDSLITTYSCAARRN